MTECDPSSFLPYEIQSVLKRKSSRDPNSRFSRKLFLLLSYVNDNPQLENQIGCAWLNDEEFKINKKVLVNIMGIKINTLNVDLNACKFIQQKHNKDGWTIWKKSGFTKTSYNDAEIVQSQRSGKVKDFNIPFTLGKISPSSFDMFKENCRKLWKEITGMDDKPIPVDHFIMQAAKKFKQEEQPLENAKEVLQAIIAPQNARIDYINYSDFARFMAMFGPEDTIMIKIASLLTCSNTSGQWLVFGPYPPSSNLYGAFNEREPNCLVLNLNLQNCNRMVYNNPIQNTGYDYVIDQFGRTYKSWEHYFQVNPIMS